MGEIYGTRLRKIGYQDDANALNLIATAASLQGTNVNFDKPVLETILPDGNRFESVLPPPWPGRQIMEQQLPGTATAYGIEDAIQDFATAMLRRMTARLSSRHKWCQLFPFDIRQVSVIKGSRGLQPARVNSRPFSNSL